MNRVRAHGKKSENMWKGEREHMQKSGTLEKHLKPEISINAESVTCGRIISKK